MGSNTSLDRVSSTVLPHPGLQKEEFEALGFQFFYPIGQRGNMMEAALPPDWGIYQTASRDKTKRYVIVDERSYERASISWTGDGKNSQAIMKLIRDRERKFDINSTEFKAGFYKKVY